MEPKLKEYFICPMGNKFRGVISIFVLWAIALSALISIAIGYRVNMELKALSLYKQKFYSRYLLWNAFVKTLDLLRKDNPGVDSLFDEWNKGYKVEDEYGECEVKIIDEERKININYASLSTLKYFFPYELAESIADWRDEDSIAHPQGAEQPHYDLLGYKCRNSYIKSLYEINSIKGGADFEVEKIKDYITVYSNGKLNINTLNAECFYALGLLSTLIDKILAFREAKGVFRSVSQEYLSSILDLNKEEKQSLFQVINSFKVQSKYFRIFVEGKTKKDIPCYALAIVKREGKNFKILAWWQNFWVK